MTGSFNGELSSGCRAGCLANDLKNCTRMVSDYEAAQLKKI